MWITSSRVLPIILLVVLPFGVSILVFILNWYQYPIAEIGRIPIDFGGESPVDVIVSGIYLVCIVPLVYGFYPIKISNLKRRGFSALMTEHKYIKNILYVEVAILFVVSLIVAFQFTVLDFSIPNLVGGTVFRDPLCEEVMFRDEQLSPEEEAEKKECIFRFVYVVRVALSLFLLVN